MKRTLLCTALLILIFGSVGYAQRGYVRHDLQVKNELGLIVTDITSITICTKDTTSAQTIYQNILLSTEVTNPITTTSTNTTLTQSLGSCYWYGIDSYDVTLISTTYGTIHLKGYSASTSTVIIPTYWSASQSQTTTDAQSLSLGSDADWVLQGGATANRLTMTPTTDGATLYFGSATRQADLTWFSGTGTTYIVWDESANTETYTGVSAVFSDTGYAKFGSDLDFSVFSSTAKQLDIVPLVTDESPIINLGANTTGVDLKLFDATDGDYALWDASAGNLLFVDTGIALGDSDPILFGDPVGTGDFKLSDESDVLTFDVVVAGTGEMAIGNDGDDVPLKWYGETANSFWYFTGDLLEGDGVDLALGDGDKLLFGDTLGTGDFSISDESDVLTFAQIVADTGTIAVGADGAGIDTKFFGEEAGDYMLWDGTGASKLVLHGADSSGVLFLVEGINTTGNTDSIQVTHKGSGDALQITAGEADSVGLNIISAANSTVSIAKVDGASGNWIGADDVGMLHLSGDTAGTHTGASLLQVANSGQPIAAAEGFLARFIDTGTARTNAYAVEIETTNTTPALFLNNQLTISGADSAGVLFDITGIDTTGNTDTMQIAHSGSGDALQITCTEADSVALNLVAAAAQTTSVMKVDGATGADWRGAANVGMVHLTSDGPLANVAASLLYINNTGVPANDSRGSSLRIVDTGNAAAGTAGYAVYISATDDTVEALYIDDGKVLVDEGITSNRGVQSASVAVTADVEANQATIPAGSRFVTITSSGATKVVCLPAPVVGNMITIYCGATGCELQTLATSNDTINGVDCDGANELAIAAGKIYHLICVADSTWIAWAWGANGAAEATLTPDADE